MQAMILAAGRGSRLRPFTNHVPKPLIEVNGQPLIGHHLRSLAAAGVREVVINTAYRGDQIQHTLGHGRYYGLRITYSPETLGALDTGGGIARALPLLGSEPFLVISADVLATIDYADLVRRNASAQVHIVLVDNPSHHNSGDFGLRHGQLVTKGPLMTYSGVGIFAPNWFRGQADTCFPLSRVIKQAGKDGVATGERHCGAWLDVGRPGTLALARQGMEHQTKV